jgi:hypothetical protein
MNPRIQELAEQAELHLELQSLKVEKFAELIVRECAKISLECGINLNREDFRQGIARNIKQHFGVEQ